MSGPEPVTTLSRREAVAADSAPAHVVGQILDAQTNGVGSHASTSTSLDAADPVPQAAKVTACGSVVSTRARVARHA